MGTLYTMDEAAEILGCHVADLEARIYDGEIRCGVRADGWRGYPVPLSETGKPKSGHFMRTVIAPGVRGWVGTFDGEDTAITESVVGEFWYLELVAVKEVIARREDGAAVEWIVPADSHWHSLHPKNFPWDRFLFRLLDTPTVRAGDLCVSSADLSPDKYPRSTARKKSVRRRTSEVCEIILSVLRTMGMGDQLLSLPDGAKSTAEKRAANEFGINASQFERAWKQLRYSTTVEMKNQDIYASGPK